MTNQEQYELICEKAKKYDRLVVVLDKIRAEITRLRDSWERDNYHDEADALTTALAILDKYKAESEGNNT